MLIVLCDKVTETCTWSFAFGPYSGEQPLPSATCLCAQTGFVSRAGGDRCEQALDKCILFLQRERGLAGLTAGDGCPTSHQRGEGRQRWSETCLGWSEDGVRRRGCQKQMCPPPCLNKSCSRSFYLHMLTGTSEFPEERRREKRMKGGRKKKNREKDTDRWRKSCAHHRCKRLKWAFL